MKPHCLLLAAWILAAASSTPAQETKERFVLKGHTGEITALAFAADGKRLASASADKTIKLWDVATGTELATIRANAEVVALALSGAGKTLVAVAKDKRATVWDVPSGKERTAIEEVGEPVAMSADGAILACIGHGRDEAKKENWSEVRLRDVATHKERTIGRNSVPDGVPDPIAFGTALAFAANGKTLAVGRHFVGDDSSSVVLLDLATGKQLATLEGEGMRGKPMALALDTEGKTVATVGIDGIGLRDVTTGKHRTRWKKEFSGPVAVNANKGMVAFTSADNAISVWEVGKR